MGVAVSAWLFVALLSSGVGAEPDLEARARELFLEGDRHYVAGRYELAVERFLEAYELSGRPRLLFNLANVHERLGNYAEAADYLRRYLETPEVHDIVSVRERLERLELTAAAPTASRPPLPQWPTWALGGATALAATSTVTFGLLALQSRREVEDQCGDLDGRTLCAPEAEPFQTSERRRAVAADLSLAFAVALGTATLTYEVVRRTRVDKKEATSATVSIVPEVRPDGGGLRLVLRARRGVRP